MPWCHSLNLLLWPCFAAGWQFWLWLWFPAPWQSSILELQQSLSPVCCSHYILLEMFLPAACTSFSGAALGATEGVSSTHGQSLPTHPDCCWVHPWSLPADTWAAGCHLRTWQRCQHHFGHSKNHCGKVLPILLPIPVIFLSALQQITSCWKLTRLFPTTSIPPWISLSIPWASVLAQSRMKFCPQWCGGE